jgi:hypothetical protein
MCFRPITIPARRILGAKSVNGSSFEGSNAGGGVAKASLRGWHTSR